MKRKDKDTEEKILDAARKAFIRNGLSGARMQEIADEAGFNKALVHYYFESKEKLFALVFEQEFAKFFASLAGVLSADVPLFEKIEHIISLDLERMIQFPDMPLFVINEIGRNPAMIAKKLRHLKVADVFAGFQKQIAGEVKKGRIRPISAEQLLINIQSLCIFPFAAKPLIKIVMKKTEKDYKAMIELRKTELVKFVINAIKV